MKEFMAARLISEICSELAETAHRQGHRLLSYLLRMAVIEAANVGAEHGDHRNAHELLVGAWDWDVVNDRIYADCRFARMFGISAATATAGAPLQVWIDAVHPEDKEELLARIRQALNGHLLAIEYRVITEGRTRWLYARGKCTMDSEGKPIRFPGAIVEITHEKLTQQVPLAPEACDS